MNARNHHGFPVNLDSLTKAATTDTAAVVSFAAAMASKLYRAQQKGRSGWDDPARCTTESLQRALQEHVAKGDPVDVANYAMMLFARGAGTAIPDSLNVLALENMQMRQALRAVLDEVSPGCTPISIDSSLPRSVIDQVSRAAGMSLTELREFIDGVPMRSCIDDQAMRATMITVGGL